MKLIIINGPCGVGKTTLSEKLARDSPLTVHLDIDAVRHMISDFRLRRARSSELAFELALGILRKSLENGCDVVLDKILFNHTDAPRQYLDEFLVIADEFGAEIHEFILTASKDVVIERADRRGFPDGGPLTPEKVVKFYDEMMQYSKGRTNATIIDTTDKDPELVYKTINNHISGTL